MRKRPLPSHHRRRSHSHSPRTISQSPPAKKSKNEGLRCKHGCNRTTNPGFDTCCRSCAFVNSYISFNNNNGRTHDLACDRRWQRIQSQKNTVNQPSTGIAYNIYGVPIPQSSSSTLPSQNTNTSNVNNPSSLVSMMANFVNNPGNQNILKSNNFNCVNGNTVAYQNAIMQILCNYQNINALQNLNVPNEYQNISNEMLAKLMEPQMKREAKEAQIAMELKLKEKQMPEKAELKTETFSVQGQKRFSNLETLLTNTNFTVVGSKGSKYIVIVGNHAIKNEIKNETNVFEKETNEIKNAFENETNVIKNEMKNELNANKNEKHEMNANENQLKQEMKTLSYTYYYRIWKMNERNKIIIHPLKYVYNEYSLQKYMSIFNYSPIAYTDILSKKVKINILESIYAIFDYEEYDQSLIKKYLKEMHANLDKSSHTLDIQVYGESNIDNESSKMEVEEEGIQTKLMMNKKYRIVDDISYDYINNNLLIEYPFSDVDIEDNSNERNYERTINEIYDEDIDVNGFVLNMNEEKRKELEDIAIIENIFYQKLMCIFKSKEKRDIFDEMQIRIEWNEEVREPFFMAICEGWVDYERKVVDIILLMIAPVSTIVELKLHRLRYWKSLH